MQKFFVAFFLLIFSFGFAETALLNDGSEKIMSFHSDIIVSKEGSLKVTEHIKVFANGYNIKRGIFRTLPLYRNVNGRKIRVDYDLLSVRKNGVVENYGLEYNGSDLVIRIGNKDILLNSGVYDYEIEYNTKNQIGFFNQYDELYWNVNGGLWDFRVDEISASIQLPEGADIIQNSCYTGKYGSKEANCTSKTTGPTSIEFFAKDLDNNEGLTIAVGFKKGIILPPPPPTFIEKYGVVLGLLIVALGLLAYFYATWSKFGRDPQKPTIYPQFNAPQNLSPASLGYINKGFYGNSFISAAIVNLAIKGYIKIVEKDDKILGIFSTKEFTLKKLKEPDQALPKEEINLMNQLFANETSSIKFDGKYSSKIAKAVDDFKASLNYQHDKFLNKGNNTVKLILPILVIFACYAAGLFLSFISTYNGEYIAVGLFGGIFLTVLSVFIIYFFERFVLVKLVFGIISIALFLAIIFSFSNDSARLDNIGFYASYLFFLLGFVGMVLFSYIIKQPTTEKLETLSLIDGFKMYLGAAEEKTLQFHNPPTMTPEVFEKMLPFAMVLGVDQIWGAKFQNMLKNSAMGTDSYQSNWYVGNYTGFNLASTLNSSLSSSIASSSTQPSSSGSGSGGGGFSGGGGGGGGGGGW